MAGKYLLNYKHRVWKQRITTYWKWKRRTIPGSRMLWHSYTTTTVGKLSNAFSFHASQYTLRKEQEKKCSYFYIYFHAVFYVYSARFWHQNRNIGNSFKSFVLVLHSARMSYYLWFNDCKPYTNMCLIY